MVFFLEMIVIFLRDLGEEDGHVWHVKVINQKNQDKMIKKNE